MSIDVNQVKQDYEAAVSRLILYSLSELPFSLGMKRFINVLKGTKSSFVIDNQLHQLPTFSIFSAFPAEQLRQIINLFIDNDLINISHASAKQNWPVLSLTPEGEAYLQEKTDLNLQFIEKFLDRDVPELNEFEKQLYNELRLLRNRLAAEQEVPPYVICGNNTLRSITLEKPLEPSGLLSVRGIGEKFVEQYGEPFLTLLKDSLDETNEMLEETPAAQ